MPLQSSAVPTTASYILDARDVEKINNASDIQQLTSASDLFISEDIDDSNLRFYCKACRSAYGIIGKKDKGNM